MPFKFKKNNLVVTCLTVVCYLFNNAWAQVEVKPVVQPAEKTINLLYQSAFDNYQPYAAPAIGSWKQANDTVKEIGGWRTYAKEATEEKKEKSLESVQTNGERK